MGYALPENTADQEDDDSFAGLRIVVSFFKPAIWDVRLVIDATNPKRPIIYIGESHPRDARPEGDMPC